MVKVMKPKIVAYLFSLAVFIILDGVSPAAAQSGCSLINKTIPPQHLSFEKIVERSSLTKGESKERVVLRLLNNTNCDITIQTYERPDARSLEMIKLPDGKVKFRTKEEFLDGGWLDNIKYFVDYREPLPPPKKRYYQVADTFYEFSLQAGRSVLFSVPLSLFDKWIHIKVSFDYD
jgi:hypothetical protein